MSLLMPDLNHQTKQTTYVCVAAQMVTYPASGSPVVCSLLYSQKYCAEGESPNTVPMDIVQGETTSHHRAWPALHRQGGLVSE